MSNQIRGLGTKDLDSGAGVDNQATVGLLLPASGGSVIGGTSTNPIRIDPTGTTTQPVSLASAPAATAKYTTPSLGSSIASTTLDSKADASVTSSILYDNSTNLDEFCDVEVVLGSFTSATSPSITLKVYSSIDGTNIEDLSGTAGTDNSYTTTLTTGTSAKRCVFHRVRLFPFKCYFVLTLNTGGTTAASGNTLKVATYDYKAV